MVERDSLSFLTPPPSPHNLLLQQPRREFFMRTDSIVEGAAGLPSFSVPLREALPLAERPDRLQPGSTRAALFGSADTADASSTCARTPSTHLGILYIDSTTYIFTYINVSKYRITPASIYVSAVKDSLLERDNFLNLCFG